MSSDRKKLLILASTYPRWENDHVPPFVHNLALGFLRHYDVTVLAPHTTGTKGREVMEGVNVERFRYAWPASLERLAYGGGMINNLRSDPVAMAEVGPFFLSQIYNALRLARRIEADVINSHWLIPQGVTGTIVSSITGIPHVITVHSGGFYALKKSSPGRALMRWVLNKADGVVSVSSVMMDGMENIAGKKLNGLVAPMGVRLDEAWADDKNLEGKPSGNLFFVGRLVEKKGVPVLLKAMKQLDDADMKLNLQIAGDGPMMGTLKGLTESLNIEHCVTFLGALGRDEVMSRMSRADALVVPSIMDSAGETEGMPVVVLEAFSEGVPVIASKVAGIPDVVEPGVSGILVEPDNPERLAEAIARFYNEANVGNMKKEALAATKKYSTTAIADKYSVMFENIKESKSG